MVIYLCQYSIVNTKWQVASTNVYLILILQVDNHFDQCVLLHVVIIQKPFMLANYFRGLINQLIIISAPTKFLCSVFLNFIKSFDLNHGDSIIIIAK